VGEIGRQCRLAMHGDGVLFAGGSRGGTNREPDTESENKERAANSSDARAQEYSRRCAPI
jgi:hypothetical protein